MIFERYFHDILNISIGHFSDFLMWIIKPFLISYVHAKMITYWDVFVFSLYYLFGFLLYNIFGPSFSWLENTFFIGQSYDRLLLNLLSQHVIFVIGFSNCTIKKKTKIHFSKINKLIKNKHDSHIPKNCFLKMVRSLSAVGRPVDTSPSLSHHFDPGTAVRPWATADIV